MREKSNILAKLIFRGNEDEEKLELYGFAIYIVLSTLIHLGTMLIIGWIFGMIAESIILYTSFIAIRKFSGGYHAKTPLRCYFFSVITIVISLIIMRCELTYNSEIIFLVSVLLALISIIVITVLSPLDNENKVLNDHEKKIYKKISVFNTILLFIISLIVLSFNQSYGLPIIFGIIISAIVLIMRKVQVVKNNN